MQYSIFATESSFFRIEGLNNPNSHPSQNLLVRYFGNQLES